MSFFYPNGQAGITVNGQDLSVFSAKLLTGFGLGGCSVTAETYQGRNRSTMLLLDQTFGPMELRLPVEVWGADRADTAEKWSRLCQALSGQVELDLSDGYRYVGAVTDFGTPAWVQDGWMTADVTFRGFRKKPLVTVSSMTALGTPISCASTFPRTDCRIRLPKTLLGTADSVSVQLGDNSWTLDYSFSGSQDLVLDGIGKVFLLGGTNITAKMEWEDFPYLVPGDNEIAVEIGGTAVARGVEISYYPTFL